MKPDLLDVDPSGNNGRPTAEDVKCVLIMAAFLAIAFKAPAILAFFGLIQ